MKRLMIVGVVVASVLSIALPASAGDFRGGPKGGSVFAVPRDPWRSWGVRRELPKHVGPPRHQVHRFDRRFDGHHIGRGHFDGHHHGHVFAPGRWVWWPGGWVR